jgi:broad-specificity NMP kinase
MEKEKNYKIEICKREKIIAVVLFFGLPGIGKTTFWHELKKLRKDVDIFLDYHSEDQIFQKLILL